MKQKNGLRTIACLVMAVAMIFLTVPSFSNAEISDYDKEKLIAFWAQTDPEGTMCNGDRVYDFDLGSDVTMVFGPTSYTPNSWETALVDLHYIQNGNTLYSQSFSLKFGFTIDYYFSDGIISGEGFRTIFPDLYGPLDMAGTSITALGGYAGGTGPDETETHIESVMLDNCANLKEINFNNQQYCTSLSAVNCPELEMISATDCDYKSIDVQPKGYDKALNLAAVCDGSVGVDFTYSPDGSAMTVYADSGKSSFLGWYCNGNLISTEPEFSYSGTGKLTACFGGDADGDGVLSMKDSVIMSRIALGLMEDIDGVSDLDADRNGSLAIADAVIIARIVLGV